jgi:general stress protein CsbA
MNGVEILNEYAVYTTQTWVMVVSVIAVIGGIILLVMPANYEKDIFMWIHLIGMLICFATTLTLTCLDESTDCFKEYSHTEYKVTIDDSVSMNEFLDKYEILDQEGKIYTVKERE